MTKEGKKFVLSASFNRNFNKFYTDFKIDKENESALEYLIKSALDHFCNVNNKNLPERVIIYRQGGNEKQTEKMMKFELPKILKAFDEYKDNYKPKLTIFGVNKKTDLKKFFIHLSLAKTVPFLEAPKHPIFIFRSLNAGKLLHSKVCCAKLSYILPRCIPNRNSSP